MKRFLPVFGLLPVLIVPAWASDLGLTAIMRTHKMSALEAAAVVVIADALHVNADFVISTGRGSGVSPVIYGPAYIYSYRTHQDFDDVWRKRKMGWGEIAHSIGMHPGTFNKLRRQGYSVDQIIWMDTLNRRYRIPYSDYSSWRKGGNSVGRILEVVARNDGNLNQPRCTNRSLEPSNSPRNLPQAEPSMPTKLALLGGAPAGCLPYAHRETGGLACRPRLRLRQCPRPRAWRRARCEACPGRLSSRRR